MMSCPTSRVHAWTIKNSVFSVIDGLIVEMLFMLFFVYDTIVGFKNE